MPHDEIVAIFYLQLIFCCAGEHTLLFRYRNGNRLGIGGSLYVLSSKSLLNGGVCLSTGTWDSAPGFETTVGVVSDPSEIIFFSNTKSSQRPAEWAGSESHSRREAFLVTCAALPASMRGVSVHG